MNEGHILTAADFEFDLPAAPTTGFVYYVERTGSIRGVSHNLDGDLADRFDYLEVASSIADDFVSGKVHAHDWFVGYQGSEPVLLPVTTERLMVVQTNRGYEVVTQSEPALVQIVIGVPFGADHGAVSLTHRLGVEVECGFEEPFDLILTKRGSLDEILAHLSVDPAELCRTKMIEFEFGRTIDCEVDVLTKPLAPIQYVVQSFVEASRPLPLPPGRYVELKPFVSLTSLQGRAPGLVAHVGPENVSVSLHEGGGRYYDRSLRAVMLALCRPGDPEAVLWRSHVNLDDLRRGTVTIDLPSPIEGDFEMVSQLYFENSYLIR